ncbi:hypothetical protein MW334_003542 [Vibrio parahaemolyticus]|nr:hypothetical protein [Vibrio parahaemolyticus]EJB8408355.1 hypothetical protein [Vibrio parahaemolyticus]ELA9712817.1 hypothetical protein [Vibrio parahaemolyticus]ELA9726325.1 hypothetical protein [Vibrio parahaemolyticus]HBC3528454.1 hypothetical protein [Vibrio parahaemolyticus]
MIAYNFATVWILAGVATWVFDVVYVWSHSTACPKNAMLSFDTFLIYVSWWPFVLVLIAAIHMKESCVNSLDSKYED